MHAAAVIAFGLLAIPQVLGNFEGVFRTDWDLKKLRGGIDPEILKRHVYVFSEFCPSQSRIMEFGDEILVSSQRPWQTNYPTNSTCIMHIESKPDDTGIIYTVLQEDTPDCKDYLRVSVMGEKPLDYCGPIKNVTGSATTAFNRSIILEWHSDDREAQSEHTRGFMILLTTFQYKCNRNQACFPCVNGLVIDQVHMCNGYDNCGDGSDELNCPPDPPIPTRPPHPLPSNTGATVGVSLVISALLAVIAVLSLLYYRSTRTHNELENQASP